MCEQYSSKLACYYIQFDLKATLSDISVKQCGENLKSDRAKAQTYLELHCPHMPNEPYDKTLSICSIHQNRLWWFLYITKKRLPSYQYMDLKSCNFSQFKSLITCNEGVIVKQVDYYIVNTVSFGLCVDDPEYSTQH